MHVITVVVDNKRAQAAYTQALALLDEAWPRLIENGKKEELRRIEEKEKNDQQRKEEEEKYDARFKKLKDDYEKKLVKYEEDLKHYQSLIGHWTGAKRPSSPMPEHLYLFTPMFDGVGYFRAPKRRVLSDYELIRKLLTDRFNMSSVAIEPFAMSEKEVREMFAWENGVKVRELLDDAVVSDLSQSNLRPFLPWW